MKKAILLLIFLGPLLLPAQWNIYNTSLTDSSQALVYVDADNLLAVSGGKKNARLLLRVSNQDLARAPYGKNVFVLHPTEFTVYDTVSLYQDEVLVASRVFAQRTAAFPTLALAGKTDSVMTIEEIVTRPVVEFASHGFYRSAPYKIIRFELEIHRSLGDTLRFNVNHDGFLSQQQTNAILGLQAGDRIEILKLLAECYGCDNRIVIDRKRIRIK